MYDQQNIFEIIVQSIPVLYWEYKIQIMLPGNRK